MPVCRGTSAIVVAISSVAFSLQLFVLPFFCFLFFALHFFDAIPPANPRAAAGVNFSPHARNCRERVIRDATVRARQSAACVRAVKGYRDVKAFSRSTLFDFSRSGANSSRVTRSRFCFRCSFFFLHFAAVYTDFLNSIDSLRLFHVSSLSVISLCPRVFGLN